jgi:hypothetical protein
LSGRKTPEQARRAAQHYKMLALNQYGGECACCGETEPVFLSIEHSDGNGAEHRRVNGLTSGHNTYLWLYRHNFPDGFEVLCHNCNHGRHINGGICPHQEQEQQLRLVADDG